MKHAIRAGMLILLLALSMAGCGKRTPVDVDLSGMSDPMAYSTIIQMSQEPEAYVGKTVRIKGTFGVLHSEAMDRYYYSCDVKDQAGCCTEGIEFILPEGQAYPERGDKIVVSGRYETYEEDGGVYGQLVDAVLE